MIVTESIVKIYEPISAGLLARCNGSNNMAAEGITVISLGTVRTVKFGTKNFVAKSATLAMLEI